MAMTRAKRHLVRKFSRDEVQIFTVRLEVHHWRLLDCSAWRVVFEKVDGLVGCEC